MSFTQYDDVVEKLATQGSEASFGESVLPGSARCDPNLLDAQVVDARVELRAVDPVTVTDQTHDLSVGAQGLDNLLSGPCGARMRSHIDVQQAPSREREDEKDVEDAEGHGRHGQEIDRDCTGEMIADESLPGLRRGRARPPRGLGHVLGDGIFGDVVAQLRELVGDPAAAPERVVMHHSLDKTHHVWL